MEKLEKRLFNIIFFPEKNFDLFLHGSNVFFGLVYGRMIVNMNINMVHL